VKVAVRNIVDGDRRYRQLFYWCPACAHCHGVRVDDGTATPSPKWTWDGNRETPTLSPSVLNFTTTHDENGEPVGQRRTVCHHFVHAGMIEYCSDNPHELNGKTVPLLDIPENYGISGEDA